MMKVYNTRALTRNQRYIRALAAGIVVALACALVGGFIARTIKITFGIVYIGFGWLIGTSMQKVGHGVQLRFSITAAILAFICFMLCDVICYFGFAALNPVTLIAVLPLVLGTYLSISINNLIGLIIIASGVAIAYQTARIV